jgi:aspartyl-tRNA(Asn)/glutamyl-tRNA(Gln) amidotransferase subunit B
MRSTAEAVAYAKELHKIVTWIGICDGNMQEGSFRCDANVSVRKPGDKLGTRREIKNLNSFKFMQQAIDYEIRWQIDEIEDGRKIEQATVLFNPDTGETRTMRAKEDSADYRYFPDPDLPPLVIAADWIERVRRRDARAAACDGRALCRASTACRNTTPRSSRRARRCRLLRRSRAAGADAQAREQLDHRRDGAPPERSRDRHRGRARRRRPATRPAGQRIADGTTSLQQRVRANVRRRWTGLMKAATSTQIIEAADLKPMSDTGALDKILDEVIAKNAKNVEEYRGGKEKALNGLVGQVMKASGGKANPAQVTELLKAKLG